jgi:hypothetical protein
MEAICLNYEEVILLRKAESAIQVSFEICFTEANFSDLDRLVPS